MKKNKFKFVQLTNGDRIFAEIDMKESENGFLKLKKPLKLFSTENDVSIHTVLHLGYHLPMMKKFHYPLSQ